MSIIRGVAYGVALGIALILRIFFMIFGVGALLFLVMGFFASLFWLATIFPGPLVIAAVSGLVLVGFVWIRYND